MDFNQVKEILALVNQSDLTEFDLQMDNVSMRMSKNTHSVQSTNQPTDTNRSSDVTPDKKETGIKQEVSLQKDEAVSNEPETELVKEGNIVASPLVGVTYMSSGPDQPVFKKIGDSVTVGDTLCIVEAMKLMNEIKSDVEGTIAEIYVEDEQVVEYNQPLFRII
jgi:acetyl-CoA carboxylase biotin carboxyl carrier protein